MAQSGIQILNNAICGRPGLPGSRVPSYHFLQEEFTKTFSLVVALILLFLVVALRLITTKYARSSSIPR